jgi:hypothetical protein
MGVLEGYLRNRGGSAMAARRVVFRRSGVMALAALAALVALGVLLAVSMAGCGATTVVTGVAGDGGGSRMPTSAATGTPRPTATATASASAGAVAGQAPAASGPQGTLAGDVVASPTCPVQQAENPCPPKPVADRQVMIETPSGAVAAKAMTDAQGHFRVTLAPGAYTVKVAIVPGLVGMRQDTPANVTVVDGRTTSVTITLDTGIR